MIDFESISKQEDEHKHCGYIWWVAILASFFAFDNCHVQFVQLFSLSSSTHSDLNLVIVLVWMSAPINLKFIYSCKTMIAPEFARLKGEQSELDNQRISLWVRESMDDILWSKQGSFQYDAVCIKGFAFFFSPVCHPWRATTRTQHNKQNLQTKREWIPAIFRWCSYWPDAFYPHHAEDNKPAVPQSRQFCFFCINLIKPRLYPMIKNYQVAKLVISNPLILVHIGPWQRDRKFRSSQIAPVSYFGKDWHIFSVKYASFTLFSGKESANHIWQRSNHISYKCSPSIGPPL